MEQIPAAHSVLLLCTIAALALAGPANGNVEDTAAYGVGSWAENLGNHRARVLVEEKTDAVLTHIPWRRRDASPRDRNIRIIEAATGKTVENVWRAEINREFGDIVFQPNAAGEYEIYYMQYSPPQTDADTAWLEKHGLTAGKWKELPRAKLLGIEARSEFDRFDPMEVIATAGEIAEMLQAHGSESVLLFPEDRAFPIRMRSDLPLRWILNGPSAEFHGEARPGEFYTFQVGVYAARKSVGKIGVAFGDLRSKGGATIPVRAFRCFNLGGRDWLGRRFSKTITVPKGEIQPLWFGVHVPKNAPAGGYEGEMTLKLGSVAKKVRIVLDVSGAALADAGDGDLWRQSRLRWPDSTIGLDNEIVAPYTPLKVSGRIAKCLGRQVEFGGSGLPAGIRSGGRELLAAPMAMVVETSRGPIAWERERTRVMRNSVGAHERESMSSGGPFLLRCRSKMEFDGHIDFRASVRAKDAAEVRDIRLEIPIKREVAVYMMGMGRKGGFRPKEWQWTWDIERANNMVWVGDADAGLRLKLKGPKDTWEIADLRASGIPNSWGNDGKGGCTITEEGRRVVIRAYSGPRSLKAGEEIEFRFSLLITPVKPLDPSHWNQRYFHAYLPPQAALDVGANIINVHHATPVNPYINYPFLTADKLAEYVKQAHDLGVKVKIYYTVRELSNHASELWALRSLGDEVFLDGPGGGYSWLREHLVTNYTPAWLQPLGDETDAAIATTGLSRWHNYYLEGLAWLLRNTGIDGLYLDGIGYDREIMKRVRKVLDRTRPGCLLDFHSGNEFTYADMRISPANKYMEHFPYVNSLWFGEMYDYDESPDYWLVEVSGIPFGLFGEMLQDGGNPWRGMIYGMTGRYYAGAEPRHIWKVWDDFGIQDAKMIGYWSPKCPVKTGRDDVLATAYVRKERVLISLASWAREPVRVRLETDWKSLGLDQAKSALSAPAIPGFQESAEFSASDEIPVEPGKGWLLILSEKHGRDRSFP